ncbi:MAG TPA: lipid-binding SYLF domain-containing protein [Tepidisphaeraceae bacterium]
MVCMLLAGVGCNTAPKSEEGRENLVSNADSALKQMTAADPSLQNFINRGYGYAIFPKVGKGAWIVGGAYGRGAVYEQGQFIGYADISQATVGLQAGGQTYMQLLVFENKDALERFKSGKLTFAANVSAVILKSGAAESAKFTDGIAVFVNPIGGAMVEAALGGQQFTFQPK